MKKRFTNILLAILLVLPTFLTVTPIAQASGLTCMWTGASSANWNTSGNWSGCSGGVPGAADNLIFPGGASNLVMNNDIVASTVYHNINVAGAGYTFAGNPMRISTHIEVQTGANNTIFNTMTTFDSATGTTLQVDSGATGTIFNVPINMSNTGGADMGFTINSDTTLNSSIGGSTDIFQKNGTATFKTYSGLASTFTASGGVNIAEGTWDCRVNTCFGDASNAVNVIVDGQVQFSVDGISIANNISTDAPRTLGNLIVPSGSIAVELTGNLDLSGGANIKVGAGAELTTPGTGETWTIGGTVKFFGVDTTGTADIAAVLSGSGAIQSDDVFLVLRGNNASYTGTVTALPGSVLDSTTANALGDTAHGTTIESGATYYSNHSITVAEPFTISGAGVGTGDYTGAFVNDHNQRIFTGTITLAGNTTIVNQTSAGPLRFGGVITGTGDLTLNGTSSESINIGLGGAGPGDGMSNDYTGETNVNAILVLLAKNPGVTAIPHNLNIHGSPAHSTVLAGLNANQVDDGAVVSVTTDVNPSIFAVASDETVGMITGNGVVGFADSSGNISLGGGNQSGSFSGQFAIDGTIHKLGTGTWTLSGGAYPTPTYTKFSVEGGKIAFNSDFSNNPVTVKNGGTLNGTGSVAQAVAESGATVAPGNSPGCLTAATLTLNSGSRFNEEITGNTVCTEYDQMTVTGAADLGNADFDVTVSSTPAVGTVFTILQAGSVTGIFGGLPDGAEGTVNNVRLRVNYTPTTVTVTVVEPSVSVVTPPGLLAETGTNSNGIAALGALIMAMGALIVGSNLRRLII